MNNIIPSEIFLKIKEAQDNVLMKIKTEVRDEITSLSQKFQQELQKDIEKIILNPFNIYLKIPRVIQNNDKLYLDELKKQYHNLFNHDLQISDGNFVIIVKHNQLVCHGDPRPKQLMVENPVEVNSLESNTIFNESERKKFESELEASQFKRPSVRSGYSGEKKDILVPLFLQRRNSRLSLPTISARKNVPEVSVSDNPEVSEMG